jgi:mRNA-degrading endonuclease RelE of RelBE toxin-antitoxin system
MSGGEEGAWTLHYVRRAEKDMAQLDGQVRRRVLLAIGRLIADPDHATGVRNLTGRPEARLRVGDWRVIFETDRESRAVIVHRVLPRGRAYDR